MKKSGSKRNTELKGHKDLPICCVSLSTTLCNKTGGWRSITPVIDKGICSLCGLCWKFCPEPCISFQDGFPAIDYGYCKGCGICAEVCPKKAVSFKEEKR